MILSIKNGVPMLLPQISVTQQECDELIIKDITPAYSPAYQGGYGGINIDANLITKTEISFDWGNGQAFRLSDSYNQTKGEWTIYADQLPYPQTPPVFSGCSACDQDTITQNDHGFLGQFPSGCATIKYEVFSVGTGSTLVPKSEGIKVVKFISTCREDKRLAELADKLTLPDNKGEYVLGKTKESRQELMNYFSLARIKLSLTEEEAGCDCECIGGRIKQVNDYLDKVEDASR